MITPRETISFNKHLMEVRKHHQYTAMEQDELFFKWSNHQDEESRELLINSNLRLVLTIAKKYQSKGTTLEDLVSTGNLSLVKSLDTYKPGLGSTFASWASKYITGS